MGKPVSYAYSALRRYSASLNLATFLCSSFRAIMGLLAAPLITFLLVRDKSLEGRQGLGRFAVV